MIGFFDSGLGGLTVLKEVHKALPEYSTMYLGDSARAPYGPRSPETIYQWTREGVTELFRRGCPLVILACNTASSTALRRLQQEFLPAEFPDRKILGVVRPAVEGIAEQTHSKRIGVLGTEATVRSGAYKAEFAKLNPSVAVVEHACPLFVPLIEAGEYQGKQIEIAAQQYLSQLFIRDPGIESVLLACTHYPIIQNTIQSSVPEGVLVYSQGGMVAEKLAEYAVRHPEIDAKLHKRGERTYLTTDASESFRSLARLFLGSDIEVQEVVLGGR